MVCLTLTELFFEEAFPDGILRRIGLDLPLSLHELYAVIQGDFSSAFSHTRILSSRTLEDDGIELELGALSPHMPAATLTLDRRNLPVRLRIPHMWDIRIDCGDDLLPRRMDGMKRNNTNGEEYRFILLIKDRQGRKQFADKELELQMPADVREEAIASADKKSLIAAITRALRKIEE